MLYFHVTLSYLFHLFLNSSSMRPLTNFLHLQHPVRLPVNLEEKQKAQTEHVNVNYYFHLTTNGKWDKKKIKPR